jgi:hypothetical protein
MANSSAGWTKRLWRIMNKAQGAYNHALTMQDLLAKRNREGLVYTFTKQVTLPANGTLEILGKTDGRNAHFFNFTLEAEQGGFELRLYEDPTVSDEGTEETLICRNRIKVTTPTLTVFSAPTVTSPGTLLSLIGIPETTSAVSRQPLEQAENREWILDDGSYYLYEVTNLTGSDIVIYLYYDWFETNG